MIYKSKARYEGPGASGFTRIINAVEGVITTNFGTFIKRGTRWLCVRSNNVELFPIKKESKP